jgi:DNA-directed RNA polymerase subunit RPC12/RpoP
LKAELIKVKCFNCKDQIFEFSFSLLKEARKIRFTCKHCGEWTTIELTESEVVTVKNGE